MKIVVIRVSEYWAEEFTVGKIYEIRSDDIIFDDLGQPWCSTGEIRDGKLNGFDGGCYGDVYAVQVVE